MRAILPFRLKIEQVEGTWKLNQNKPGEQRLGAARKVEGGVGQELQALAHLMKDA